jgi:hypothetical protein
VHYSFITKKMPLTWRWCWILLLETSWARGRACVPFGWLHLCLRVVRKHPALIPSYHFTQKLGSRVDCPNKSPAMVFLHSIWSSDRNRGANFCTNTAHAQISIPSYKTHYWRKDSRDKKARKETYAAVGWP